MFLYKHIRILLQYNPIKIIVLFVVFAFHSTFLIGGI